MISQARNQGERLIDAIEAVFNANGKACYLTYGITHATLYCDRPHRGNTEVGARVENTITLRLGLAGSEDAPGTELIESVTPSYPNRAIIRTQPVDTTVPDVDMSEAAIVHTLIGRMYDRLLLVNENYKPEVSVDMGMSGKDKSVLMAGRSGGKSISQKMLADTMKNSDHLTDALSAAAPTQEKL